ncbi:helix-turn-helix domain containing protein [Geodermatophilus sp. YIM 151500]|uniref:helix-turn-helix domain containing protein n=1 Tax=Geodermatophilus sp. YIM 151500 TaxID=2984531 RepID=UPI0021E3F446|nr:helix-turn-helix domain containing protein [Geodermatophilus sp. YIM 151500]MCV2489779.1 helix-turn-helix domain containing protein [Geodermatophilus sp. YIM 151500]
MRVSRTCLSCGYTADYGSAPLADAHHRRHSCAKHRGGLERVARRAERLQSRVPRECSHPQARHRHGTRAAYVKDRCRCADCTAANTAASRTATRERTYGRWQPYVDAGPVRDHIAALRAAGTGVVRIAQLAGPSVRYLRELAEHSHGDTLGTRRVRPSTATRILAIGINDTSRTPHSRVDATGTRRRLQALIAIGWPAELLAAHLGRRPNSLHRSMTGESVTASTAHDVATLYQRLWDVPSPRLTGGQRAAADAARAHAATQGWQPPLAWDDIDTDPTPPAPATRLPQRDDIDEIAVERALAGDNITYDDLTSVEQQEVIRRLSARGTSNRDTAAQLGATKRTISRRRASLGAV